MALLGGVYRLLVFFSCMDDGNDLGIRAKKLLVDIPYFKCIAIQFARYIEDGLSVASLKRYTRVLLDCIPEEDHYGWQRKSDIIDEDVYELVDQLEVHLSSWTLGDFIQARHSKDREYESSKLIKQLKLLNPENPKLWEVLSPK